VVVVRATNIGNVPEATMVDVYLPSGALLTSVTVAPSEIESGRIMLMLDLGEKPEMGSYRVIFHGNTDLAIDSGANETQFELRLEGT